MDWLNAIVQGVLLGGLYALLATGLSLVFGVMRLVNLAQGDLTVAAAYLTLSFVQVTRVNPLLGLIVIVPAFALIGYLLQRGLLNFTLAGGVLPPVLVTFGLAVILQNVLLGVYSADSRGLDAGAIENSSLRLTDDLAIGWFPLVTLVVAILILASLQLLIARTGLGRALRATADDRDAARLVGIDDRHIYAIAMAISLWGTLVGGVVLGVAQALGNQINPAYQLLAGHLVFLGVLAFRPRGLFNRQAERRA